MVEDVLVFIDSPSPESIVWSISISTSALSISAEASIAFLYTSSALKSPVSSSFYSLFFHFFRIFHCFFIFILYTYVACFFFVFFIGICFFIPVCFIWVCIFSTSNQYCC